MKLKNLQLVNYRNYDKLYIEFNDRINLLLGSNGQGKTNIAESIYLLAFGKSFRTNRDRELIKFNTENLYVGGGYEKNGRKGMVEIAISKAKKWIKVNKIPIVKLAELLGNINVVIFSPEDLRLVKDGPKIRRSFIDREISQIVPGYYGLLTGYNKILANRNKLLKNMNPDLNLLDVYDESLADYGSKIFMFRKKFIERIAEISGSLPVISSASDFLVICAIDVFAWKNHLYIEDMQKAKQISAKILEWKTVGAAIESGRDSIEGTVPEEVKIVQETYENPDIYFGIYERKLSSHVLRMIPQRITVGIGCRRGTSAEQIEQLVDKILKESHINKKSIGRIASIDLKKDEEGLLTFCNKYNIEPEFYPAEELKKVEGEFSVSTFVKKVTGVDNVCERSAVYTGGTLRIRKQAENGVTAAFAWDNWRVKFE